MCCSLPTMNGKKHKRARSPSESPKPLSSDDDSPNKKGHKVRESRSEKHSKKHKRSRPRSSDSSSSEVSKSRPKDAERHKECDVFPLSKIKEEPKSDDERIHRHRKRPHDQGRVKEEQHTDDERTRNPKDRSDDYGRHSRGDRHGRRPDKAEVKTEPEPEWGEKSANTEKKEPQKNNAKPDFGLSGKLTEDANTFNGIVIKYSEPPEARKPKRRWRLYPFKGETSLPVLHIHRQSAYLLGRDRKVADIPIDHPSCSKQHAALQYRLVPFARPDGTKGRQIKLYVIDLESANGTFLNNNKIEAKRYYEYKERDVVKFGFSSREYVLLHEHSKDSDDDDDVND